MYEQQIGIDLDRATADFLEDLDELQTLRIPAGADQLTAFEFCDYLGIDHERESELTWLAREMCNSAMPPQAEMIVSKSRIVYFYDILNEIYTLEHPLLRRYQRILEKERLDLLALRTKPSIYGLIQEEPMFSYHRDFPFLQMPCEDCSQFQATKLCEQCVFCYCDVCFSLTHDCEGPKKRHTSTPLPCGISCGPNQDEAPEIYDLNEDEYYTREEYEKIHAKGGRSQHRSMLIPIRDGVICDSRIFCEECRTAQGEYFCSYCRNYFCTPCFQKVHESGRMAGHVAENTSISQICVHCLKTRATVFCLNDSELTCTDCFTRLHCRGNRQQHIFTNAVNFVLLLEKSDPGLQEHLTYVRARLLACISRLQAYARGVLVRQSLRRESQIVTKIQQRWRGKKARKRLMSILDQYRWRKKEVANFLLPETESDERRRQKVHAALVERQQISLLCGETVVEELKETIAAGAYTNPLEDQEKTKQQLGFRD